MEERVIVYGLFYNPRSKKEEEAYVSMDKETFMYSYAENASYRLVFEGTADSCTNILNDLHDKKWHYEEINS